MLVYGDHSEIADPRDRLASIAEQLGALSAMRAGIGRHAQLVGALVDTGQLQQGVEDRGCRSDELRAFVYCLAACVVRSWDSHFAELGDVPRVPRCDLPVRVELRLPEGFAFYALYPEAYIRAARALHLSGPPRVIGIRSIGTTVAAVAAAALRAKPPETVRPFGDPFARRVELPSEMIDDGAHYVIVDEGPGLSGSSFGSVADELERRGVPLERIAFLPSHGGDLGREASDAHRRRWREAQRIAAEFDLSFLEEEFGPLEQLSTGHPWERRKFLARRDGRSVLLKFAGLGSIGQRKLEMARALHATGFAAEPLGLVHGFLAERWGDDAQPLDEREKPIEEIGRYIGARARLFPARKGTGASLEELLTMCRRNISLALGDEAARAVDRWQGMALRREIPRVCSDNKLDREEWLRTPRGKLLKTDALDHHLSHDLIGCQPIEWDIAGAIAEFDLDDDEAAGLIAATRCGIDRELLGFCRLAYAAFRLGHARLAAELTSGLAGEQLRRASERYAQLLLLHESACVAESARNLV